jgi:hypothetical protein
MASDEASNAYGSSGFKKRRYDGLRDEYEEAISAME